MVLIISISHRVINMHWVTNRKQKSPFGVFSVRVYYFIFISQSSHLEQGQKHTVRTFTILWSSRLQTRSLPGSTGFSQQRIITHNNINSYSPDTQNSPLVFTNRMFVCLAVYTCRSISDYLSVGEFWLLSYLSVRHIVFVCVKVTVCSS